MLRLAVRRLTVGSRVRFHLRDVTAESKAAQHISCSRYFSSSPALRQASSAAVSAGAPAGPQIVASAEVLTKAPNDTVTGNVLDISAGSDVTISQIAEGLSTDLLTASGIVPTLQDMGLGSYYTPPGWLQNTLDLMHDCGMPWWAAIVSATFVMKTLLIPLVVKAQRNSTIMNNIMPEIQRLQLKMTEAKQNGNALEAARAANELNAVMQGEGANVFKGLMPMLIQTPVFISFFMALRGMANLPMESMKTGGIYWFTDLTVADPYYILPLITCGSVFIMLETGADGMMRTDNMKIMKYVMRALPCIMFPITMNFPSAVLCYWTTSNLFSLGQTIILRRPAVRKRLNIPLLVKHDKADLPGSKKGFVEGMKESYNNVKISNEVANRARRDEIRFKQAGTGPVRKTFKHPQKVNRAANE